jgi:twitching motility protein PilT
LPAKLIKLSKLQQGLVLVTGPTGSGKTTTVAALLNEINRTRSCHIVTLEDPIEYLHQPQKALIHQRQIYRDTKGFSQALYSALRQDPDIIFVGELRDSETMKLALTASETGHLVLATLHTCSAAKTIHRVVDMCATEDRTAIRSLLSASLQAILSQTLLKGFDNQRHAAFEVLWATPAIRHLIKEDNIAQIVSTMQTGRHFGMQTMEQAIAHLRDQGILQNEKSLDYSPVS